MSRTRAHRIVLALAAAVVAVTVGAVSAAASERDAGFGFDFFPQPAIVGTWDVTLTLPGPTTGRVLATFEGDGTTVESAAVPGTLRGASHGVWERLDRRLFSVTRVFFRFENGAFVGTTKVNATVRVSADDESFTAVSVSELRGPGGNLIVGGIRGTAVGTRMHVERMHEVL